MRESILKYAGELDAFGDLIKQVSKLVPVIEDKGLSKKQLAIYKEQLIAASDRYQFILNEIRNIEVPQLVTRDHEYLLSGISSFILGTKLMRESINIEEQTANFTQLKQGDAINVIGVNIVQIASRSIGEKLVSYLNAK